MNLLEKRHWQICMPISIFTIGLLAFGILSNNVLGSAIPQSLDNGTSILDESNVNSSMTIKAGGGNSTIQLMTYSPAVTKIFINDAITWINPSSVPEPHTVTFMKDKSQWGNLTSYLVVGNASSIVYQKASENPENAVILNYFAGSLEPRIINSYDQSKDIQNSSYYITGNEKYINSGWIWPEGQKPGGLGNTERYTITFGQPGEYEYFCLLHPWMTGVIIVK
jgi:plastocyanin